AGLGIEIIARTNAAKVLGKDKVEGIETTEGRKIACQMVIVGKGVDANKKIVEGTDIQTEYGIIIDDHCRTSVADVYAAGDVTQSPDSVRKEKWMNSLWPHAVEQGRVAAENILGKDSTLRGGTSMNSFTIGELALISCGLTGAREKTEGAEELAFKGPGGRQSRRFIIKDNRLVGFALVGNVANAGVLTSLVAKGVDITKVRDQIISGEYDFAFVLPLIKENPDKFTEPEYQEVLSLL
ncbi:MAG: FAD-dependent oxidoreductase, partial [Phycisphaerae bacterium]|nr:FAD-dependent oxidoreductase [Phycisphaerae bacterium]